MGYIGLSYESIHTATASTGSNGNEGDGGSAFAARNLDGLRPTTSHESGAVAVDEES